MLTLTQARIGTTLIALACATLAHAQVTTSLHSTPLVQGADVQTKLDEQRAFVLRRLTTAMMILRDDKPFYRSDVVFGRNYDTEPHPTAEGARYRYATGSTLPTTRIDVDTVDDPEDYSANRKKVKIVPIGVSVDIGPMLPGISHTEIENLLQLDNYWIGAGDERITGNELIRFRDNPNLQVFRYRTKSVPGSRFPVDVEVFYANPVDGSSPPKLAEVRMMRAYKVLTPEERAQRRREQQQAKRQKYGEMNLCTGMLCPETGMWQGFSESNAADVTVVWKGQKFPSVRTLTHQEERDQRRSTNWVDGQWMWLREFDDSNPHVGDKGI
ncbi:hypothetical protein LGN17_36345 [Burkholderia sp. AU30280]|uniref:hypothetical protein n=1 Tax=Burkholderia sp. AU30280 TaxID=2879628 RepID=UPI001CF5864C|nr:hypothetical protein [Burkholderia sp. AU30280]MCA8277946.1 hypothetical protein [Burkholderia sp. AU30280]